MGGLGDHFPRLPRGLGEYLEPGALDGLKPAELEALRAAVASRMPSVRGELLQPHGLVDFVGPRALKSPQADRLTADDTSWLEQIGQELGNAFTSPRYIRPRPSPAGISRELRRQFPGFADYLSNSAEALGRMPRDLAGMLGDFRANPLDFLSQAGDGLTGLGMAIPVTRADLIIGAGTKVRRSFNYTNKVLKKGPSRPYVNSPLLIQEIMSTGRGRPDPGGLRGGLRYDVPGRMGKAKGHMSSSLLQRTKPSGTISTRARSDMKFRLDRKDQLPNQKLLYRQEAYAFDSEPSVPGFTNLSVNTLSLEIDSLGKIVEVWGYCPHVSWIKANLTPPDPKPADIYALSDEPFLPGVGVKIVDNEDLPIYFDPASGWVHIPGERTAAASIMPLPGVVLQLTEEDEFAALWLKPARLPRYGYKRSRGQYWTPGGLMNALRNLVRSEKASSSGF